MCTYLRKYLFSLGLVASCSAQAESFAQSYDELIEKERIRYSTGTFAEDLAGGIAALSIGFYGYYFDDRNVGLRLAYAATQTIGVLLIGDAIYKANRPSELLITEAYLQRMDRGDVDTDGLRRELLAARRQDALAKRKRLAYSSAILSVIYAINAANEPKANRTIINVNRFLALNAGLVSLGSFYSIYFLNPGVVAVEPHVGVHGQPGVLVAARWHL